MEDNKNMVTIMAAHMSDAGRMMRQNRSPSLTTVRGLMEAVRWLDRQRRLAVERLNVAEGRLFQVAGETPTPPMLLQDALTEFLAYLMNYEIDHIDWSHESEYKDLARGFIEAYADSFPDRRLPGVAPKPHTQEEEL